MPFKTSMITLCLGLMTGCQSDKAASSDSGSDKPTSLDTGAPQSTDTGEDAVWHTVSTSVSGGGFATPVGDVRVNDGRVLRVDVTPDEGWGLAAVTGTCGGSVEGLQFRTAPVTQDCSVIAVFEEVIPEPAAYCSGVPAEVAERVVCDPEIHLDNWSLGASYWTNDLRIPSGKILSLPFTANAIGRSGTAEITNNMPGLHASGLYWHGWFSVVPGGEQVDDSPRCRLLSPNPNPSSLNWSQKATPGEWDCDLGATERTLYFNMEVRCFEEYSSTCTPGETYADDYYNGIRARPREE